MRLIRHKKAHNGMTAINTWAGLCFMSNDAAHWTCDETAAPQEGISVARLKSGSVSIHARLTADDINALKDERARTGSKSIGKTLERLLVELLDDPDNGWKRMAVVPRREDLFSTNYLISPQVKGRIDALRKCVRITQQQILRAAIAKVKQP